MILARGNVGPHAQGALLLVLMTACHGSGSEDCTHPPCGGGTTCSILDDPCPDFGVCSGNYCTSRSAGEISRMKWQYAVDTPVYYGSPAVGADGTVFFSSGVGHFGKNAKKGSLTSLTPAGQKKWTVALNQALFSPVLGQDGSVYVLDKSALLHVYGADGSPKWTFQAGSAPLGDLWTSAPAISSDGTVLVASTGLYAIKPDGALSWMYSPAGQSVSSMTSPVVGSDGTVYVAGSVSGHTKAVLCAVNSDGTEKWTVELTTSQVWSTPAIGSDGTLYVGGEENDSDGALHAVSSDGSIAWTYPQSGPRPVRASPVIGADGTIYIGSAVNAGDTGAFMAINPDGTLKWAFDVENLISSDDPDHEYTSAVVASDAKIYFAGPHLYAINPDGTLAWKLSLLATGWTSPTIAPDGTLYFGEFSWSGKPSDPAEGLITAVKTGSQGFAASAWPKYRHDANNAGVE